MTSAVLQISSASVESHGFYSITVDNTSGSTQTDYQIKIPVTFADGMNSDFSNITFYDTDASTQLPFWIENYTSSTSADFWTKLPSLTGAAYKKIYYRITPVVSQDGANTFATFADFEGSGYFINASSPLTTPTYEGSGQATEPGVVYFPSGWNGYNYWMAMTPYPSSTDTLQNPSILASNDNSTWVVPAGVTNPLVPPPATDHNNDTELFYNAATDELWMLYLWTNRSGGYGGNNHNYLNIIKSSDGVTWSSPATLIDWNLATQPLYVQPSIDLIGGTYKIWMGSTAGPFDLFTSSDGSTWSSTPTSNTNITTNEWHGTVRYISSKSEYMFLFVHTSSQGELYASFSSDGITWSTPGRIMGRTSGWDGNLYKPTFVYDSSNDTINLWYAAYTGTPNTWQIGYTSIVGYDGFKEWVQGGGQWNLVTGHRQTFNNSATQVKRGSKSGKITQQTTSSNPALELTAVYSGPIMLEFDLYDDGDTSAEKLIKWKSSTPTYVGIGVYTTQSTTNYVYNDITSTYTTTSVSRTVGWHKFGIQINTDSSVVFYIDDVQVGSLSSQFNTSAAISIQSLVSLLTTYYVDDIRVRKYMTPEPSVSIP